MQSNEDRRETQYYLAKAKRRMSAIRLKAAQLAVMPAHQNGTDEKTLIEPWKRAREVIATVEEFEKTLAPHFARFPDLPEDFMQGYLRYPGKE